MPFDDAFNKAVTIAMSIDSDLFLKALEVKPEPPLSEEEISDLEPFVPRGKVLQTVEEEPLPPSALVPPDGIQG